MPTYQYRCQDCSNELEVVQKFTDDPLTDCPGCDGNLRKVYSAVGVVFKGSGFYATDNRSKKAAASTSGSGSKDSGADSAATNPGTETKAKADTSAKPAAGPSAA